MTILAFGPSFTSAAGFVAGEASFPAALAVTPARATPMTASAVPILE
jgi:hypothetical protein